jgi:ATP-dependent Clp protease ATP-binding subunit ClpC
MSMEIKFTKKAKDALLNAEMSGYKLKNKTTDVDNLLYGLTLVEECTAAAVLDKYFITASVMDQYLTRLKGPKEQLVLNCEQPKTENYERVLNRAQEMAVVAGMDFVSTDFILLSILDNIDVLPNIEALLITQLVDINEMANDLLEVIGTDEDNSEYKDCLNKLTENIRNVSTNTNTLVVSRKEVKCSKILLDYGIDLTKKAQNGETDPLIGREKEIDRMVQILGRKNKNNPILIGDPGVGKTSLVEGLSLRISKGDVPEHLRDKVVISLSMGAMLAGAKYRGEFEERIKKVLDECTKNKDILLFIDELHSIIGAGSTGDNGMDAANIMKPYLSDGRIQIIGATTIDEYRKIIETDKALSRRFQTVMVVEPTPDEALSILNGLKETYEQFHGIKISDEAIEAAVKLSVRYITDRFLPDKALDVLDEAASMIKINKNEVVTNDHELELVNRYNDIFKHKEQSINELDLEQALRHRKEMVSICKELGEMNNNQNEKYLVEDDICNVISSWTGIPIARMNEDEKTKLLQMESIMHESIVGQEEAIRAIATAIRRNKSGLRDPKKPIASFMFLGSTGVGKTETVKALAKVHYGSEDNIIRLDMSEYMEKHAVSKLIGAPPGYVGHDDGGQLTNAVRTKPYSIVLFDEIEKAHPDVFNMLLQILDDGRLTDSKGRVIDFKNTIIIMTSNLGASLQKNVKEKVLGFGAKVEENKKEFETDHEKLKENILEACKAHFRPEFLNRLDELIVYHNLNEDHVKEIINILTRDLRNRLEEKNITLTLNADVVKYLIKQGTDLKFGARPLARAIQKHLMDGLSTELLSDNIVEGDNVLATFDEENEKVLFEVVNEVQEETEVENSLVD